MEHDSLARRAKEIVDRLASAPRAAGSGEEGRAREFCAEYLKRLGYHVTEESFSYSALPGKWGVPGTGFILLLWFLAFGAGALRTDPGRAIATTTLIASLSALLYINSSLSRGSARFLPRRGTNLVAVRDGAPDMWLMAHLDSKSQPVPMLVRIGGIVTAAAALPPALALLLRPELAGGRAEISMAIAAAGVLGSSVMVLSTVGNRSPGAMDNASGVAAALLTAETSRSRGIGIVLTSAEEVGLAGAWAWARSQTARPARLPRPRAINFDSLDDVGQLTCMGGGGNQLSRRVREAAKMMGREVAFRRVLPGIMVDANALNRSGWDAVTLCKGNLSTLARIHSGRDSADRIDGRGIAEAVELATEVLSKEG